MRRCRDDHHAVGADAARLGRGSGRRVRVGAIAATARGDPDQRIHPAVHRSGVPRLGVDPGAAVYRWQSPSIVAPQEVSVFRHGHCGPAGVVMAYRAVRRLLFLVPAERIPTWVFAMLRATTAAPPLRRLLHRLLAPRDPLLASTVFGVHFPGPLGLAAGFDKNGAGLNTWGAL